MFKVVEIVLGRVPAQKNGHEGQETGGEPHYH